MRARRRGSVIGSAVERDRVVDGDFLDEVLAAYKLTEDDLSPADAALLRARYAHWYTGPHPGARKPRGVIYAQPWRHHLPHALAVAFCLLLASLAWFPFSNSAHAVLAGALVALAWHVADRHVS